MVHGWVFGEGFPGGCMEPSKKRTRGVFEADRTLHPKMAIQSPLWDLSNLKTYEPVRRISALNSRN